MTDHYESLALELEASGDYRVLRRIKPRETVETLSVTPGLFRGIVLDQETTGLERTDEVIELAMVPFSYTQSGQIVELGEGYQWFQQPSFPIPPEITEITGITDAMVAGQEIDREAVAALACSASIIIAHHAEFDRPFAERLCPIFETRNWACSMKEIDWRHEGAEGTKLAYLLQSLGLFYDRHRALSDCVALVELLSRPLPRSGVPGLARLLETARRPTSRIWAEQTPFAAKDELKARGYRWNNGDDGRPKAWFFDATTDEAVEAELSFLSAEIYRGAGQAWIERITARDRHSAGRRFAKA
jgi:DNA polymerase-3 subunit epsilon